MRRIMAYAALLSVVLLSGNLRGAFVVAANDESTPPLRVRFETHVSEISNLTYQLDCLAGLAHGSQGAFKELWQTQLRWSPEDENQLARWRDLRNRYQATVKLSDEEPPLLAYPPDHPNILQSQIDLHTRLRIASYQARSREEYRNNLSLLIKPEDAFELMQVVDHVYPRFHQWWAGGVQTELEGFAAQVDTLVKNKSIAEFCVQVAKFYNVPQQGTLVVPFNLMYRPKSRTMGTNGEQVEWHSVIEVLAGEKAEDRIDVICHELFHYLKRLAPKDRQIAVIKAFTQSREPYALAAYNLLDESLATAIGNGLVARRVVSEQRFKSLLEHDRGFYNDFYIDRIGKRLMPVVESYINDGRTLDGAFVADYLRVAREAVGDRLASPLLQLRIGAYALEEKEMVPLVRKLTAAIRPSSTSTRIPIDEESLDMFEQYAELSGVIIVRYESLKQLRGWEQLLGKNTLKELQKLKAKHRAFVYSVRRSPRSCLYIFTGEDLTAIEKTIDAFVKSDEPFTGLKFEVATGI